MEKERVIEEIKRVAAGSNQLSQTEFQAKGTIGLTSVRYAFGSWNKAVIAAGLKPFRFGHRRPSAAPDRIYLDAIIRVTRKLRKRPTEAEFMAENTFSLKPYRVRWGTFAKAREAAYEELGDPLYSAYYQAESRILS